VAAPIDARVEKLPRRAGPRVAFQSRVLLELEDHAPVEGVTLDVGLGGMCAQVGGVVALDRIRRVEVQVGRRALSAPARGAWRREAHGDGSVILGMQFTDLEDVQISLLWETLNRRALELTRFLVEHSSLHPIEVDVAMDLALRTRRRELGPDRYLYRQGSRGPEESIFIIASGSVALEVTREDGESVVLDRAVAGNVFGGLPMLASLDHVDSARTLDATQLLEVDRYSFADLLAEKPLVGRALERAVMTKYLARFRAFQRSA
jgi:hypothetical protein